MLIPLILIGLQLPQAGSCPDTEVTLVREYENFTQPNFALGEYLPDGLVLGLRYSPQTQEWFYWLETPELDPSTRWWSERSLER